MNSSFLREAECIIAYTFQNPRLLEEALTHSSFADGSISYEQLEFIGDAVLSLALTNQLLSLYPGLNPGDLTKLRSANISNEKLARVAVRHGIYSLVQRNSTPGLDKMVEEFTEDQTHGGSQKRAPKVLADVVEAIVGAIYKDCKCDLDMMWEVVRKLLEPLITLENFTEQPIKTLHELCQKSGKVVKIHFRPERNTAHVFVNDQLVAHGISKKKMIAKQNAARNALEKLNGKMSSLLTVSHLKKVGEEDVAKQKLNVLCGKRHWPLPIYQLEEEKGPAHDRAYKYAVHVKTAVANLTEVGEWRSRVKGAEKSAALKMLSMVVR